jgi:hypothetical protein
MTMPSITPGHWTFYLPSGLEEPRLLTQEEKDMTDRVARGAPDLATATPYYFQRWMWVGYNGVNEGGTFMSILNSNGERLPPGDFPGIGIILP